MFSLASWYLFNNVKIPINDIKNECSVGLLQFDHWYHFKEVRIPLNVDNENECFAGLAAI